MSTFSILTVFGQSKDMPIITFQSSIIIEIWVIKLSYLRENVCAKTGD